jgi:cytochrome c-type biogenesis protein CcmH/NrfG
VVDDLIRDYRKALADRPDDASTLFSLGLALVRKGWTEEALAALRRAQTIEPGVPDVAREIARIEKTVTERRRDTRL